MSGALPRFLRINLTYSGGGQKLLVDDDEQAAAAREHGTVRVLNLRLVEQLATFATEMAAYQHQRLIKRDGAEIIDLHVARHGKDVERPVQLTHRLVEQRSHDTAVNVAGWTFMELCQLNLRCGDRRIGNRGVRGKDKM